ncbi:hypothetical protein [Bradyrhizobium cenepequi]
MSVQIFLEVENDPDPQAAKQRRSQVEQWARSELSASRNLNVEGTAVRSTASIDPAAVASVAVILTSVAGAVGAGATLLAALRKMVVEGGALIRAIKVEINGEPRLLEAVSSDQLEAELRSK